MIDDNGLPISRRASVEVGASNLSSRQSLSGGGPISLGSALKELQNATRAVLDKAAVDNAAAAAIVHGYEQWENKLRSDAQNRLVNGLATPLALTGSSSGGMKRSASENSLFGASESNMGRFLGPPRAARFGGNLLANEAHQSSNESSMSSGGIGYGFGGNDASSIFGPKLAPIRLRNTNTRSAQDASLHHPPTEELHRMHRVPTSPISLKTLSDQLNQEASKNIELIFDTGIKAIRCAQSAMQETATNCHANLQALQSIIQHSVASSSPSLATAKEAVAWSLASSSDPFTGALVPWTAFPKYQRSGSKEESSIGGLGSEPSLNVDDWVTPFDRYLHQLELSSERSAYKPPSPSPSSPSPSATTPPDTTSFLDNLWGRQGQLSNKTLRSLKEPGRSVAIVTTASLPWMTGTAVNPLLRAAYLSSDDTRKVTLVIPWLSASDQDKVFPTSLRFETPEAQEAYVRDWAKKRTGLDCKFRISFYAGRYAAEKGSILPVGDITHVIPDNEADVAVLEEPEHLNWYHHGRRWTDKFTHVVGIMHTNYLDYARREEGGQFKELMLKHINQWVCRIHCHKVIKLSDAVQHLPREHTMFVHGVSPSFLQVGKNKAEEMIAFLQQPQQQQQTQLLIASGDEQLSSSSSSSSKKHQARQGSHANASPSSSSSSSSSTKDKEDTKVPFSKGVYFIGKVLWAKGYTELIERMNEHAGRTGHSINVDVYGSGPDLKAVEEESHRRKLNLRFQGAKDHADSSIHDYKVFVNPSLSDVVATTTAEALAMGKFVVCADHPSNRFFKGFSNCLIYRDGDEFSKCLETALSRDPKPLSEEELHSLTWEAATDRFLDVADLRTWQRPLEAAVDNVLAAAHNTLTGIEGLRIAIGAGAKTRDAPVRITDYQPDPNEVMGLLDRGGPLSEKKVQKPKAKEGPKNVAQQGPKNVAHTAPLATVVAAK